MSLIAAAPVGLSKQRICQALGQPRHRCYPDRRRRKATATARAPARRLSAEQDEAILTALHSERFIDASPRQVHAHLLSEGIVLASCRPFIAACVRSGRPRHAACNVHRNVTPDPS